MPRLIRKPTLTKSLFPLIMPFILPTLMGCTQTNQEENAAVQQKTTSALIAPAISRGRATAAEAPLLECDVPGWRVTTLGKIVDTNGQTWQTPAQVNYVEGPKATDLFNECNNITLADENALDINSVPIKKIDDDGEIITAYFFGDNYAEIFVNGTLIGVDPVPYWPFNTSVVRFQVKKPFLFGVKLVDWEENLNLGSELMRGVPFHNGDGGFVAVLKDEHSNIIQLTDDSWRVQIYYASPLLDEKCVVSTLSERSTDTCVSPEKINAEQAYAARWPLPENWAMLDFDDSAWSFATTYTNEEIGGSLNRPAYSNFSGLFDTEGQDAQFIWSSNLLLDNLVLARKVID